MVFSSPIFLFGFLPLFLALYAVVFGPTGRMSAGPARVLLLRASNVLLLLASLLFYFWGEGWLVLVMLTSAVIDFVAGQVIAHTSRPAARRAGLVLSVTANLGILAFFKYANFGVEAVTGLAGLLGLGRGPVHDALQVALPLGISFYTFQSMSYTIDVYRGQVRPTRNFLDFACFVTMFPQLVAGPIVRYRDVADQLRDRRVTADDFGGGCVRFTQGLVKKVLIANTVAGVVDTIWDLPADQVGAGVAWLGTLGYALQIYFDFSAYSDMAIGLGRMLGFRFPENFNYPYAALSVQDFWRRWHISLSTWFRDYLYIPLGGGRVRPVRVYFNLVTVFFLCGLWHGAAYGFILFGLHHGLFLVLERMGLAARVAQLPLPLRLIYTHLVVNVGWVCFRAADPAQLGAMLRALAGMGATETGAPGPAAYLSAPFTTAALLGAAFALPLLPWLRLRRDALLARWPGAAPRVAWGVARNAVLLAGLVLAMTSLASGSYNPFIYFRF